MSEYFERKDGEILDMEDFIRSQLSRISGAKTAKFDRSFTATGHGGSVPLSSQVAQRDFTLNFTCADTDGIERGQIYDFFSSDLLFYLTDSNRGYDEYAFWVVSIDPSGENGIDLDITCKSRWGIDIEEFSQVLATFETPTNFNATVSNSFSEDASILVKIEADSNDEFEEGSIEISDGNYTAVYRPGKTGLDGSYTYFVGKTFSVDSWDEIIDGTGEIDIETTGFFRILPGNSATVSVSFTGNPMPQQGGTITISLYGVKQK